MMTKKYYTLLAEILHQEMTIRKLAGKDLDAERSMIGLLCQALRKDNIRFDRYKFQEKSGYYL